MAIEASLREAREREMLVKPATIETQENNLIKFRFCYLYFFENTKVFF